MTEEDVRRRRRHRNNENGFRGFLRKYRFELIWLLVVALGVFLLFERMSIRSNLVRWVRIGLGAIARWMDGAAVAIGRFITGITLSDALGYALILGALLAILLRTRWRLMHTPSFTDQLCPKCGGEIHRVHRRFRDTVVSRFVPVRRYRCSNRECRWYGVRVLPASLSHRSRR